MMTIPQMIDPSVPIGPTTARTLRLHASAIRSCPTMRSRITPRSWRASAASTWTARGRVAGNGFYYLMGDIARLHEAVIAYARDFMIGKGFTYCIRPS